LVSGKEVTGAYLTDIKESWGLVVSRGEEFETRIELEATGIGQS